MITSRPSPAPSPTIVSTMTSSHVIGDEVIFAPASQIPQIILAQGVVCKVVGVTFEESKVLYDLALPLGFLIFHEDYPLLRVDSIFVYPKP